MANLNVPHGPNFLGTYAVPTPHMYPSDQTPEGRHELYKIRAKWFVLAAFDYELSRQQCRIAEALTFEDYIRHYGGPNGWHYPPLDPFEPIPPIVFHETYGGGLGSHRYFAPDPPFDPADYRAGGKIAEAQRRILADLYNRGVDGLRAAGLAPDPLHHPRLKTAEEIATERLANMMRYGMVGGYFRYIEPTVIE